MSLLCRDECEDEMAKVLGLPSGTTFSQLLEHVTKLKEESAELLDCHSEVVELGEQIAALRQQTCCNPGEKLEDRIGEIIETKNKYRVEVEKLAETADEAPDCCCDCDKRFDLHSHMNCGDCSKDGKQIHIAQMYDHYFGGPDDDGDICTECLIHRWPEIGAGFPTEA